MSPLSPEQVLHLDCLMKKVGLNAQRGCIHYMTQTGTVCGCLRHELGQYVQREVNEFGELDEFIPGWTLEFFYA